MLRKELEAPAKPNLSATNQLDVSCFDKSFTTEEAEISIIPSGKMSRVNNKQEKF